MDDPTSLFSVEDDGSLLILSRISGSEEDSTVTIIPNGKGDEGAVGWKPLEEETGFGNDGVVNCDDRQQQQQLEESDEESEGVEVLTEVEIEQILIKERDNLEMIRKANEKFKSMIMASICSGQSAQPNANAVVNTINSEIGTETSAEQTAPRTTCQSSLNESPDHETKQQIVALNDGAVTAEKPYQKLMSGFSNKLRRRRQPNRAKDSSSLNVQTFIQDYYRSLTTVSRYIIAGCILSSLTTFLLLSWYSAQTHSQDMELFNLKEKRVVANQEAFDKYQRQNENFRESIIHQRYEESRECQSSLKACHSKRDELLQQVSKLDQNMEKRLMKATAKSDNQLKEIQTLHGKIRNLQEENMTLRKEIGQSLNSSFAKILLSFLNIVKNRSVQIVFGTGLTVIILVGLICTAFSK